MSTWQKAYASDKKRIALIFHVCLIFVDLFHSNDTFFHLFHVHGLVWVGFSSEFLLLLWMCFLCSAHISIRIVTIKKKLFRSNWTMLKQKYNQQKRAQSLFSLYSLYLIIMMTTTTKTPMTLDVDERGGFMVHCSLPLLSSLSSFRTLTFLVVRFFFFHLFRRAWFATKSEIIISIHK